MFFRTRHFQTAIMTAAFCVAGFGQTGVRPKGVAATPGLIPIGSPLTFGGTNDPDTYSATTTFSSTPVLVDNGAVKIWQQQVATGTDSEWDLFYMQTVNGGPLANNLSGNWSVTLTYTLSVPVFFDQVVNQWLVNGTPVNPISNFGTICCAATTNPILPGPAYYNSGFDGALAAGPETNWQQIYVDPYSFANSGGIPTATANEFIFGLHFTKQPPAPVILGVISASAFGGFSNIAPGTWIEIYGTDLALGTQTWGASDFSGVNAPTKLGNTSVTIGGQSAFVDFISPLQVNVQVPNGIGTGNQSLVLTTPVGPSAPFQVNVNATEPGMLAASNFKISGTQYVVAQFGDGSYVLPPGAISGLTSNRAKAGDEIVIYGIGFGDVDPTIPPGQLAEVANSLVIPLTVTMGGAQVTNMPYYGLAPNYVGLYQFNFVVPAGATVSDTAPFIFSLGGASPPQTLAIAIGN